MYGLCCILSVTLMFLVFFFCLLDVQPYKIVVMLYNIACLLRFGVCIFLPLRFKKRKYSRWSFFLFVPLGIFSSFQWSLFHINLPFYANEIHINAYNYEIVVCLLAWECCYRCYCCCGCCFFCTFLIWL